MNNKKRRGGNADVKVVVVSGEAGSPFTAGDRLKIERAVKDNLLAKAMEPYQKVQVEVERKRDGTPKTLVVSMLRALSYTADIVKLNVDANYNVKSVER